MRHSARARRAQLGAGIAAGILAPLGLVVLLFAPVVSGCVVDVSFTNHCPPRGTRYVSLLQAGLGADAWALLLGLCAVVLVGAAGAVLDARHEWQPSDPLRWVLVLWIPTVLAIAACAATVRGIVGLGYLPAALALCVATSASLARRQPSRQSAHTPAPTPSKPPSAEAPSPPDPPPSAGTEPLATD